MADEIAGVAPSLPAFVLYPTALVLVCLLAWLSWRTQCRIANFILFAVCGRYMMSAFHQITFAASPVGMSWNALGSCLIVMLGLLLIDQRMLRLRFFLPVYVLVAVILLSGIVNADYSGTINAIVKYGYFVVVAIGTCEALEQYGEQRFMRFLLWAFSPLIIFQIFSLLLGVSKAGESDGSVSVIGGYNHEAAFSIALATGFVVAALARNMNPSIKGLFLSVSLVGLFLANYRTSILAIAPIVFAQIAFGTTQMFPKSQRPAIGIAMVLVCFIIAVIAAFFLQSRFHDLATIIESGGHIIKPPDEFTRTDQMLLSGRAELWSKYIYGYLASTDARKFVGFGANSWIPVFGFYAHNTLVSQLYEYGVLGVFGVLYLWIAMFYSVVRVRRGPRGKLIAAHLSFIVLSFATMPLWMIEGYIFYGIICGYTLFLLKAVAPSRRRSQPMLLHASSAFVRPLHAFNSPHLGSPLDN